MTILTLRNQQQASAANDMSDDSLRSASESQRRSSRMVALTFAAVAGYVDAYSLMKFQVYASFMSGNTTRAGVEAATAQYSVAALSAVAIVFFVVGAFGGVMILYSQRRRAASWAAAVALALLLVQAAVDSLHPATVGSIILLSISMGVLNATISRVGGQPINIGYVSGGLHKLAEHLAQAYYHLPVESSEGPGDTHLRRAALIVGVWAAFLGGAFAGATMQSRFPAVALAIPVAAIFAVLLPGIVEKASEQRPAS